VEAIASPHGRDFVEREETEMTNHPQCCGKPMEWEDGWPSTQTDPECPPHWYCEICGNDVYPENNANVSDKERKSE
jgi:hypothetical protein